MPSSNFLQPAPPDYNWPRCPEADQFLQRCVAEFLASHPFAKKLSERMLSETGTEFFCWVDHLILPADKYSEAQLAKLGIVKDNVGAYWHPYGDFPRIVLKSQSSISCAIMVDSIRDFLLAHGLSLPIQGRPFGLYREASLQDGKATLKIVERRGSKTLEPDTANRHVLYLETLELWLNRRRHFSSIEEGLDNALKLARNMAHSVGTGMAAWAFLEAERCHWQSRNHAGRIQKLRQDKLGLGWANHDHHTFRSSRSAFSKLMEIFMTFGFKKRERYYAGAEAGWGAQVLEQPEARLIIFADVDLTPEEIAIDFASDALPPLDRPGTIGLWCGLHGDSILESGMHHLEAKFNFDQLKSELEPEGVKFMKPFTDFPHLRQAFSEGELWQVPAERLEPLRSSGKLSAEAYEQIKAHGAVGSHLENLQRRDGFKGFNQRGVSDIIRAVNPESQALKKPGAST